MEPEQSDELHETESEKPDSSTPPSEEPETTDAELLPTFYVKVTNLTYEVQSTDAETAVKGILAAVRNVAPSVAPLSTRVWRA